RRPPERSRGTLRGGRALLRHLAAAVVRLAAPIRAHATSVQRRRYRSAAARRPARARGSTARRVLRLLPGSRRCARDAQSAGSGRERATCCRTEKGAPDAELGVNFLYYRAFADTALPQGP